MKKGSLYDFLFLFYSPLASGILRRAKSVIADKSAVVLLRSLKLVMEMKKMNFKHILTIRANVCKIISEVI